LIFPPPPSTAETLCWAFPADTLSATYMLTQNGEKNHDQHRQHHNPRNTVRLAHARQSTRHHVWDRKVLRHRPRRRGPGRPPADGTESGEGRAMATDPPRSRAGNAGANLRLRSRRGGRTSIGPDRLTILPPPCSCKCRHWTYIAPCPFGA